MISIQLSTAIVIILLIIQVYIGQSQALSIRSSNIGNNHGSILRYHVLKRTVKLRKQLLLLNFQNEKTLITDEVVGMKKSSAPSTTTTTTASSNLSISPSSVVTVIPSRFDSTTIAHVLLSHAGITMLSTIAFGLLYGIATTISTSMGIEGDISYMNDTPSSHTVHQSAHWITLLFLGCGGSFPLIHTSHAMNHPTSFGRRTSRYNDTMCTDKTLRSMGYRNQMEVTHMVLQILGRRRRHNDGRVDQVSLDTASTFGIGSVASSTTASSIIILSMINSMTAISSELIYRLYIPTLLLGTTSDYMISIMVPAVLYGVSHTQWHGNPSTAFSSKAVVNMDTCMLLIQQTIAAMWYSMLYMCSGSIVPCIISHYLYDMDLLTSSWHSINNQMDFIDNHSTPSTINLRSEPKNDHPPERLTSEATDISHRFFLAFDSEHVGSWNEYDLDRALQYLHYNIHNRGEQNDVVSTVGMFHQYATLVPSSPASPELTSSPSLNQQRLQYTDYLRLLQHIYNCSGRNKIQPC